MALTKLNVDVNNIQTLADQPTETATVIKQKFDKAGADIKAYLNDTLTVEIDNTLATKQEVTDAVAGAVPEGSLTDAYLSNNAADIKTRFSTHLADIATAHGMADRGLNAYAKNISSTDLNNLLDTGFYSGNNLTNALDTGFYYVEVVKHGTSGSYTLQRITGVTGTNIGKVFQRVKNTTWTTWVEILHTGNAGFVSGTYVGDNVDGRIINLGFTPKLVLIRGSKGKGTIFVNYGSIAKEDIYNSVEIVPNGFKLYYLHSPESYNIAGYGPYDYVAFK